MSPLRGLCHRSPPFQGLAPLATRLGPSGATSFCNPVKAGATRPSHNPRARSDKRNKLS